MISSVLSFVLRILVVAVFWVSVWRFVQPKTQATRILRAVLLVLGLLGIMSVLRIVGR